ncbi:hypothetical protein [Algiphilus sp.]|uniref:hypothetical protein n=1 Tax=Algiphilus sp. TaxID=1872431 RepID=UPI003B521248
MWQRSVLWGVALALTAGIAQAQPAGDGALSPEALARCASEVHRLRTESLRLLEQSHANDVQRASLAEQRRALAADPSARPDYNARAEAFNAEMQQFRADVRALNALKAHYERHCAQRPYRRADLEALPEAHRYAMRQGLSDIRVPFFDEGADAERRAP